MSAGLYKLGKWCATHKKRVLFAWIIAIVTLFSIALIQKPSFSDSMSIPGTPSEKASKLLEHVFGKQSDNGTAKVIFETKDKITSPDKMKVIQKTLEKLKKDKNVKSVTDPYKVMTISENQKIAYAVVTYKMVGKQIPKVSQTRLKHSIEYAKDEGLKVKYNGDILPFELEIGGISEVIGIVMAYIVLAVTFASLIVAGLPILTAVMGLLISISITMIGTKFFDISSFSLSLTVMIGLAVGIDYALFIFSKHRHQVARGLDVQESIARAVATAGGAVIFAGLTVIIALTGLTVVGIPFLGVMGVCAAIGVLMAVLISITAVPAILSIIGKTMNPFYKSNRLLNWLNHPSKDENANFWGKMVTKRPWVVEIIGIALLVVISLPASHMRLGLPDDGMKSNDSQARQAYDLLSEGFGKGFNGPLAIVVDASDNNGNQTELFAKVQQKIEKITNVKLATQPQQDKTGKYALISVIPKTGPNDEKTAKLVHDLRDIKLTNGSHKADIHVTGLTAINIDIAEKLQDAIPVFASLIISFAFILLVIVFRSLVVPFTAVAGFLLTLTATLGFSTYIIQDGHFNQFFNIPVAGPLLAFLPILVIGILFGLAMDYQVFLVSRMREEYVTSKEPTKAILVGLKHSGPVVIAAGLIMIFVFTGFIFAGDTMIKSMGIALAFGVLFDAFIIRMTIIPALMKILGHATWYLPKWLDKIIPNVDIEGHNFLNNK